MKLKKPFDAAFKENESKMPRTGEWPREMRQRFCFLRGVVWIDGRALAICVDLVERERSSEREYSSIGARVGPQLSVWGSAVVEAVARCWFFRIHS